MINDSLYLIVAYFSGLFLILITPGPSMILFGSVAALRGMRAVVPLLLGSALGDIILAVGLYGLVELIPEGSLWHALSNSIAAFLIGFMAWQLWRSANSYAQQNDDAVMHSTHFTYGFFSALTNPFMVLYLSAQFLGPLKGSEEWLVGLVIALSVIVCVLSDLLIALIFSHRAIRELIAPSFVPLTRIIAMIFMLMAMTHLQPVIAYAGGM
jgi:threonine/homoserine/homoserine lactone efflux protein